MKFSTQIVAVILNLLVVILPLFGVTVESDRLETTIQTLVAVGTGAWIWFQRTQLRKVESGETSDVTVGGFKK